MDVLLLIEINGLKFPLDRKYYTKNNEHLWLKNEKDLVKIGMDAFAAKMLGVITILSVSKKHVKSEEEIGNFEANKFISKIHSPITGNVVSINKKVLNNPQLINEKPYESWILKIKPDKTKEKNKYLVEGKNAIYKWIIKEFEKKKKKECL